jgi:hypothetical protein
MGEVIVDEPGFESTPLGKQMLKHFLFNPAYKNLNHGIYIYVKELLSVTLISVLRFIWNIPPSNQREAA